MRVIVVSKRYGNTRSFGLGGWARALISVCVVGLPVGLAAVAYKFISQDSDMLDTHSREAWVTTLHNQETEVEQVRKDTEKKLSALTLRISELQARLVRLDALGERLTKMAML